MSVSTTHRRPCQDSSMSTCRASCADRPGRNPKLHGKKSASKTGSSTIFAAACTIRSRTAGIESGLCSSVPGFGMNTRRAGIGRYRPSRNSLASSSRSRVTPYSSTAAKVVLSMPGAPLFVRTLTHARHRTSLRLILSYSAWNRRPGSALAARYSACCKARTGSTGIPRPDPCTAGLALTALTGPLLHITRTDEAAALPSPQVVLSCGSTGTTAASDAHPASDPLPGVTGYRTPRSGSRNPQAAGPGRASPVPAATLDAFRAPYAGESFTAALPGSTPLPWPSPRSKGLGTPCTPPSRAGLVTTPQASRHATDRIVAPPYRAFDAGLRPGPFPDRAASLLPGLPGSYPDRTFTGKRRRAYGHEDPPWR